MIKTVAIPFSDMKKEMTIFVQLEEIVKSEGKDLWSHFEKGVSLSLIDEAWKDHLRSMDDLKQEVQTAHFEQKDPLVIYKIESFKLFKNLMSYINREVSAMLFKGNLPVAEPEKVKEGHQEKTDMKGLKTTRDEAVQDSNHQSANGGNEAPVEKKEPIRVGPKIGRNDLCPCGSGKKFKHCHGA